MKLEIPKEIIEAAAKAVVPALRQMLADTGDNEETTQLTFGMTETIEIDGITSRVRVEVILSPDEYDNGDCDDA